MTGMVSYQGSLCYANCHQSAETREDRYFWVYPLTPEEQVREVLYQEWFREYIGLHCDYTKQGQRRTKPKTWTEWLWDKTRYFKKKEHTYNSKILELGINREDYIERKSLGFFKRYSTHKEKNND